MSNTFNFQRRHIVGAALASLAAVPLGFSGTARAAAATSPGARDGKALPALGPIRQIKAGELDVGYYEAGPADGIPVLLLHGYPYDIHSYVEVAPLLAARGCRVIVPHLRGHGSTRFIDPGNPRSAQQSAVALDQIALLDALGMERAVIAGYDWGARTACIMAALWPQRCIGLLTVNGYIMTNLPANLEPLPATVEHGWWYQYYFATERGRKGLEKYRREIAQVLWKTNSPKWQFDDATLERTAASFDNPDYVHIVIHNYRWRLGLAPGFPQYEPWERRLAELPAITVPTITMDGNSDGVVPATDGKGQASKFIAARSHRIVEAGHNVPQEAPQAFADAVWELAATRRTGASR